MFRLAFVRPTPQPPLGKLLTVFCKSCVSQGISVVGGEAVGSAVVAVV